MKRGALVDYLYAVLAFGLVLLAGWLRYHSRGGIDCPRACFRPLRFCWG
jgi:hypothetical protein